MDDLRRAVELRAAGCVVAEAGAADALFVLLVALLARLFVLADQFEELGRQAAEVAVRHRLGKVVVELVVGLGRRVLVERDNGSAVLGVLDVALFGVVDLNHLALGQFVFRQHIVFVHDLSLLAVGVLYHLGRWLVDNRRLRL